MSVITSWMVLSFGGRIDRAADAVRRHGEAIFHEGDSPTHQYHRHERNRLELEGAVPSKGPDRVREKERNEGSELRKGGRRHIALKRFWRCAAFKGLQAPPHRG